MNNYILVGHEAVPEPDILKWAMAFEDNHRIVSQTTIHPKSTLGLEKVMVSTVFLGIDHNFFAMYGEGKPILFETMIFGGPRDEFQQRYCTWDEAEAGHKKILNEVIEEKLTWKSIVYLLKQIYNALRLWLLSSWRWLLSWRSRWPALASSLDKLGTALDKGIDQCFKK